MPSVVIWLVDEDEKFQTSEKQEHIDDCEDSGMQGACVAHDSDELGETGADAKVVA